MLCSLTTLSAALLFLIVFSYQASTWSESYICQICLWIYTYCLDRFNWENLTHSNLLCCHQAEISRVDDIKIWRDVSLFFLHSRIFLYVLCSIFFLFSLLGVLLSPLGIKIIVKSKCILNRSFGTKAHFSYQYSLHKPSHINKSFTTAL